jgi:guanylate kinase
MVRAGEFAEHAFVHRNRYGTAAAPVEAALAQGRDVIFDVDWQGGGALSTRWPEDCLKIFVLPPDLETLERRLRQRATDAPHVVETRLRNAKDELTHYPEYEHLIVNDDLERAYALLRAIYLTRKYGEVSRADVPYDLPALARLVKQDRDAAWAHGTTLVGR